MQHWTTRNGGILVQKRSYPTKRAAKVALAQTCNKFGWERANYDIYKCQFCGQYHFGRISRTSGKRKRKGGDRVAS